MLHPRKHRGETSLTTHPRVQLLKYMLDSSSVTVVPSASTGLKRRRDLDDDADDDTERDTVTNRLAVLKARRAERD